MEKNPKITKCFCYSKRKNTRRRVRECACLLFSVQKVFRSNFVRIAAIFLEQVPWLPRFSCKVYFPTKASQVFATQRWRGNLRPRGNLKNINRVLFKFSRSSLWFFGSSAEDGDARLLLPSEIHHYRHHRATTSYLVVNNLREMSIRTFQGSGTQDSVQYLLPYCHHLVFMTTVRK